MPVVDIPRLESGDRLRLVEWLPGGISVPILDLENGDTYRKERDTFKITPAAKRPLLVQGAARYEGQRQVGETHENGTLSAVWVISGSVPQAALDAVEELLGEVESARVGRYLEWRPSGAPDSSFYEIRGTATYEPEYSAIQWAQRNWIKATISWPIAPHVRELPCDIEDNFPFDTRDNYRFDAGGSGDYSWIPGFELLQAQEAGVGDPHLAIETTRSRKYLAGQATAGFFVGANRTGYKGGVVLRQQSPTTYIEVYVDDDGTNSRLRVDTVVGGARANLRTQNLAARIATGGSFFVRGRIEGQTIFADHFLGTVGPSPMAVPANFLATPYTLDSTQQLQFPAGGYGWSHTPVTAGDGVTSFSWEPWTWRDVTTPAVLHTTDDIPGDRLPSKLDLHITPYGGSTYPVFALASWIRRPATPSGSTVAPFGIIEAETSVIPAGWTAQADAGAVNGNSLRTNSGVSGTTYQAFFGVDPETLDRFDFENETAIEVWARVLLTQLLVTPRMIVSMNAAETPARYTLEWGRTGKYLVPPSAGGVWRLTKLGTLMMPSKRYGQWTLSVEGPLGAGTSGFSNWGFDYLVLVPAGSRVYSPTGKPNDTAYPRFARSTAQTHRTITSDLKGLTTSYSVFPPQTYDNNGLSGEQMEIRPGPNDVLVKLSSAVPDDPTVSAASDFSTQHAAVHLDVHPVHALVAP